MNEISVTLRLIWVLINLYTYNSSFIALIDMNTPMQDPQQPAPDFFKSDTPHGYVKRLMWMKHLQAFVAKTQNSGYTTLIYDGFAGAGLYPDSHNEPLDIANYGSPIIALRVSIQRFIKVLKLHNRFIPCFQNPVLEYTVNNRQMGDCKVQIYLVEANKSNCDELVQNVQMVFRSYQIHYIVIHFPAYLEVLSNVDWIPVGCRIYHNIFENVDPPTVTERDRLVTFIDPFGYTQTPMYHVEKFLGSRKEIFINFMSPYVNRFFTRNEDGMCKLFGMDIIQIPCLPPPYYPVDRIEHMMSLYKDILKGKCDRKAYALSFEMRNISNRRAYHMIFISCHEKGFESMKEAMNTCSQNPTKFILSDFSIIRKNEEINLQNGQIDADVAKAIFQKFIGKNMVSIEIVRQYVLHDTLFVWRKTPLKILCDKGKITNVVDKNGAPPKRRGTFPGDKIWFLTFSSYDEGETDGVFDHVIAEMQSLNI